MKVRGEPYILMSPNGDGTSELVAGSFDPFTITLSQRGIEPAIIASEMDHGLHIVKDTISSDSCVQVRSR